MGDPKHEVVEEKSLDEKLPRLSPMRRRDTLAEDTKNEDPTEPRRLDHGRSQKSERGKRVEMPTQERHNRALVKSGPAEEWWGCTLECRCYLRNVLYKTADGKTTFEKRYGQQFDGPSIPFDTLVECIPITAKDMSRVHHVGRENHESNILGPCATCGVRLVRRLDDSRL